MAAAFRIMATVNPLPITQGRRCVAEENVPDVAGFMHSGIKGNFHPVLLFRIGGDNQADGLGVPGKKSKIDPLRRDCASEGQRGARFAAAFIFHIEMVTIVIMVLI
jgi:hypothetical protein